MSTLRLLLVEDSPDDAKLIELQLEGAGLQVRAERVETEAETRAALARQPWDVVLADFALPTFRGVEALSMLREVDADTPFIIVSGAIDAETALEAMRAGAADYVLKRDLGRLPPVVIRELEAAGNRRLRHQAELERDVALVDLRAALVDLRVVNEQNSRLYEATVEDRIRAEAELESRRLLQEVTTAATSTLAVAGIGENVLQILCEHLGLNTATLYAVDSQAGVLKAVTLIGPSGAVRAGAQVVAIDDESIHGRLIYRGLPFITHESDLLMPVSARRLADATGRVPSRWIVLPIKKADRAVGVIGLFFEDVRSFEQDEIALYQSVAELLGSAFENARLFEAERESSRLTESLNTIDAAIHSTLEFDEVMQNALYEGVRALGCDSGAVEMLEADEWVVRQQHGFSPEDVGMHLSKREAPSATLAAQEQEPLARTDMAGDPSLNVGFVKRYGLKSVLAVPLLSRGSVIGCALFYTVDMNRRFTEAEIGFGRRLGASVALALDNARLYTSERDIAERLQEALLEMPDGVPGIEFGYAYRSATETAKVGGDFYDIFELDADHVGLLIGDVSGKGIQAATLTSLVKHTVRALAYDFDSPADVVAKTNDIIHRSTSSSMFVTLCFCVLDLSTGHLAYCRAGHPYPILWHRGSDTELLDVGSAIAGARHGVERVDGHAQMDPGDVLVLYTDGVTEARRDGELLGEERLVEFVRALYSIPTRDVPQALFDQVAGFSGGGLSDDIAVVAVSRKEC